MAILKAYALPHPPLAVEAVGKGEEKRIQKTLDAFLQVSKEIAELSPETIIFITPHNVLFSDYIHISKGLGAKGNLRRFGAPEVQFEVVYDTKLTDEIIKQSEIYGVDAGYLGEKNKDLDHGVTVPMWFINKLYSEYMVIRVSQSGLSKEAHYKFGQSIRKAVEEVNRKVIVVASGDLSHKLKDSPYGTADEGLIFDKAISDIFETGDFVKLLTIEEELKEKAAECGYNSFVMMIGCLDRQRIVPKLYSYEGPYGVGYAIASFTPIEKDEKRNLLDLYLQIIKQNACEKRQSEDIYCSLARESLEHMIKTGKKLIQPPDLPKEMTEHRAGVFVTIYKDGSLRGCIGTISPVHESIASEIINNAVLSGLEDTRFTPIEESELPYLVYKVDVLAAPEAISSPAELDVKRYGVIVSYMNRRGLLLPNLDGVDTVEHQIEIARRKGGIPDEADVTLERFEVIRHG